MSAGRLLPVGWPGLTLERLPPPVWIRAHAAVERASRGEWQLVGRRARDEVVIAGADEIADLLAVAFPFAPEVFVETTGVEIWLPELEVYGQGSTLDAAKDDLVEAALDFVGVWEAGLRSAPNQRQKGGHVRRVQLARDQTRVADVLFGSTPGDPPR